MSWQFLAICVALPGRKLTEKFGAGKNSRNQYRKNLVPEKVSEPVLEKFGTGKKYRNQYWKNLVPELIFLREKI